MLYASSPFYGDVFGARTPARSLLRPGTPPLHRVRTFPTSPAPLSPLTPLWIRRGDAIVGRWLPTGQAALFVSSRSLDGGFGILYPGNEYRVEVTPPFRFEPLKLLVPAHVLRAFTLIEVSAGSEPVWRAQPVPQPPGWPGQPSTIHPTHAGGELILRGGAGAPLSLFLGQTLGVRVRPNVAPAEFTAEVHGIANPPMTETF